MKFNEYYKNSVRLRRPYIKDEWCLRAIQNSDYCEKQKKDGRWRYWKYIPEWRMYLRVVTEPDGETVFNAFFDRDFKERE